MSALSWATLMPPATARSLVTENRAVGLGSGADRWRRISDICAPSHLLKSLGWAGQPFACSTGYRSSL